VNFCCNGMGLPLYQSSYAFGEKFEIKTTTAVALFRHIAMNALLAVAYMRLVLE